MFMVNDMAFETILVIIIISCLVLIWYLNTYNKFQAFIIRINEAEANIDSVLRKRYDLLSKASKVIEEDTKEENVLTQIKEMKSSNLSNFEVDRIVKDGLNEFSIYKEKYPKLKDNELFLKTDIELINSESEIISLKKYYNDIITDYNKYARIFPSCLVAFISRYKQRTYFDGKDMNDKNIKDFKI